MMDLQGYIQRLKQQINNALDHVVPDEDTEPVTLHQAMRHSLFAGGKRMRPMLVLEACRLAGGDPSRAMDAALGIECLHTFTLIHDDLPCMDDDDLRRGVPTCHKVFGEDIAILAGDALVFLGMELLARSSGAREASAHLQVVRIAAATLGSLGVIGGQVLDLQAEGQDPDRALLETIHLNKTAKLIMGSMEIGGLLGGADPAVLEQLRRFGQHFGLAFQITDDILDVTGESQLLGKKAGRDQEMNKMTYPALMGVDQAREVAREQIKKAGESLSGFNEPERWFFEQLAISLQDRVR